MRCAAAVASAATAKSTAEPSISSTSCPKFALNWPVGDGQLDEAVEAIMESAATGEVGDGKIFVSELAEAIRIRTGETGENAL